MSSTKIRQLNEYFAARIDKEKKNITDAEFNIEWISDNMKKEKNQAKNILRLAENRLRMLEKAKEEAISKANATVAPEISSNLVSLNRIIIY